jgi:site-specific recombinase XerD
MKKIDLQNSSFIKQYEVFDRYVHLTGLKSKTNMYQKQVNEFLFFLEQRSIKQIKNITSLDLIAYYEYLQNRPNLKHGGTLSSSTIANNMITINSFFELMVETKVLPGMVVMPRKIVRNKKQRDILTQEEINQLFKVCQSKKDKAILCLVYGCGLRRTEIDLLNVYDVIFQRNMLIVRKGKNDKRREIPLSLNIQNILKDYLVNERHLYINQTTQVQDAFLLNNKGTKLRGEDVNRRLKKLIALTKNEALIAKNISLHCLRHTIAVHLLENDIKIEFVRDFLGHQEINTTQIYAKRRREKEKFLNLIS